MLSTHVCGCALLCCQPGRLSGLCVHAAGSDSYVTKCIWKAGFGMTDPGYSYFTGKPLEHFTFDRWTYRVRSRCSPLPVQVVPHGHTVVKQLVLQTHRHRR